MLTNQYKKSYEGDYTKTYKNSISGKIEYQSQTQEYQTISKKLNDKPYNQKERSSDYNIAGTRPKESERIYADGRSNRSERGKIKRNWDNESTITKQEQQTKQNTPDKKPTIEIKREIIREEKETQTQYAPPLYHEIKEKPKPWKNAYEEDDDGNYNYHTYPIEEIGFERYRNLKTKKEIGLDEARKVLEMAGYEPKPNNNIGAIVFIFIAANVAIPFLAPLVAIGYGLFRMKINTTTWEKNYGKQVYKYSLPSTDGEIAGAQIIGKIAIGVGGVAAFIHYS